MTNLFSSFDPMVNIIGFKIEIDRERLKQAVYSKITLTHTKKGFDCWAFLRK